MTVNSAEPASVEPEIVETYHGDGQGGLVIQRVQDCQAILDANKKAFNEAPKKWGEMSQVASVPMVLYEKWMQELPRNATAKEKRDHLISKLNDPDNRFVRTRPGRI